MNIRYRKLNNKQSETIGTTKITILHNGAKWTLTPEGEGLKIIKVQGVESSTINIIPSCANAIIIE